MLIVASGCVVAGRLAYADPNLKVMLIEGTSAHHPALSETDDGATGGSNNRDDPWVYRYARSSFLIFIDTYARLQGLVSM